jgi:hypothetical protein
MRKADIDHLLEAAVAKALGVHLPRMNRKMIRSRKPVQPPVRHAA